MPTPIGLANLGNTCYLNSCIQLLLQIPELAQLNSINNIPATCLIDEWRELYRNIENSSNTGGRAFISPSRFVQAVRGVSAHSGNKQFAGFGQNDASEFLYFLLNHWHDACKRPVRMQINGTQIATTDKDKLAIACYEKLKQTYEKEYSEIMHLFFGISVFFSNSGQPSGEKLQSPDCQGVPDLFSLLNLPLIPNQTEERSVLTCLRAQCVRFWSLPKYLFIVLGRFCNDYTKKDTSEINVPAHLDMSEFMCSYNPQKYKYDLKGIVIHLGSIHGGHYVSVVRNLRFLDGTSLGSAETSQETVHLPSTSTGREFDKRPTYPGGMVFDNHWYSCNDTTVVEETNFIEQKLNHPIVKHNAYVLFYEHKI